MSVLKNTFDPEYTQFSVSGVKDIDFPFDDDYVGLAANRTCISVGCQYYMDGPTTITMGDYEDVAHPLAEPRFDGYIDTPDRRVDIFDANIPEILSMAVPQTRTRVRIWTNHKTEPDDVVIALG